MIDTWNSFELAYGYRLPGELGEEIPKVIAQNGKSAENNLKNQG